MSDQEDATQDLSFTGFIPPISNYFRMPNEWINICAKINNLAELKVVQYVLRHTWGFREYDGKPKAITIDEFMHGRKRADGTRMDDGTGLSKPSVIQGLKCAIKHGYLTCEIDDTDKARVIKSYALKMSDTSEVKILYPKEGDRGKGSLPQESKILTARVKDLDSEGKGSLPRSEKETSEKYFKKNTSERKNGTSQQRPNIATGQESSHSSGQSSFSSSQEKVTLTEDVQRILDFAKKSLFKARVPEVTEKLKSECAELAQHIKTQEQFDSLLAFVQTKFDGPVYLKNMVNALNDWLQTQFSTSPASKEPSLLDRLKAAQRRAEESRIREEEEQSVSDEDIADEVRKTARIYQDEDNFEEHFQSIQGIRDYFNLSNYDLCDKIVNARRGARPDESSMQDFFYELRRMVV